MKIFILGLFFISFLFVQNVTALPLVFKTVKNVKANENNDYAFITDYDSSKYKSIRIGVKFTGAQVEKDGRIQSNFVSYQAVEADDLIFIYSNYANSASYVIENAPSKIRISALHSGEYKIFIWAQ